MLPLGAYLLKSVQRVLKYLLIPEVHVCVYSVCVHACVRVRACVHVCVCGLYFIFICIYKDCLLYILTYVWLNTQIIHHLFITITEDQ